MLKFSAVAAAAGVVAMTLMVADAALAACTRLAFSVNDYGKVGPANDAKNLLDKFIAKWTADRKISGHTVGPKDVTCELFLDVGFFDEYTCKAAATVCWNGPLPAGHQVEAGAAATPSQNKAGSGSPARAKAAKQDGAPIATGSVKAAPAAAPAAAAPAAAPKAPAAAKAVPAAVRAAPAIPAAAPAKVLPAAPPAN